MTFPVFVYKDGEKAQVNHAVDLAGWLADGWQVEAPSEAPTEAPKAAKSTNKGNPPE